MDNPYIYSEFGIPKELGPAQDPDHPLYLMTHRKRPKNIVVYGRSLDTFCFIGGMLKRGHDPNRIKLIIPPRGYEHRDTFLSNEDRIDYEDARINEPDAFKDETCRNIALEAIKK